MPRKANRKATAGKLPDIRAVAAVAKVSIATVSRTINGSPLVSDRLTKRVWQAIKQLNYFPNTHARTLVSGRSRLLGIIVENITNPFFSELIQSFEEIAVARGYEILVSSTNSDPAVLAACARRMLERKVDGVAVMTFGEEEPVLDQIVHRGVPIVLAEFKLDDPKASTILLDYSTGIHAAVRHLAGLGHRAIAFLAGPHSLHSAITRENDFRAAMQSAGLPIQKKWIIECDHTLKGGVAGFAQLRKLANAPHRHRLLQRYDRHWRLARSLHGRSARAPGSVGDRPRRHRFCRVHAAPADHHSPLARGAGAGRLRGAARAGRRTRKSKDAARIPGFHQSRGPRLNGRAIGKQAIANETECTS